MSAAKSFPIIDDADILEVSDDDDVIDVSSDIDISIEEPASETGILIRDAIACVREVARLEDKVVLPPLPALAPRTNRVVFEKNDLARAANDVTVPTPPSVIVSPPPALSDTQRTRRHASRSSSRFPLALCAIIAIASAVASYVVSPMASKQPAVKKATAYVVHEASAAKAWVHAAVN